MAATATPVAATPVVPDPRQQFLSTFDQEFQTTMRVLRAYPADKLDLRPAPVLKTARELAWVFASESLLTERILTTGLGSGGAMTSPPETWEGILATIENSHASVAKLIRDLPNEKLFGTVKFFTAPKTMSDIPTVQFLWFMLFDQIHHRGQFSIYTRIAGGKLPSIYGPTADEPWM